MPDVTRLLETASAGDRQAAAAILPLVYDELRKLAAAKMASEKPDQTLNATALVHEAYLRLIGDQEFDHRGHFFAAAAEAMRRILIEAARRKKREKHGGERPRVGLVDVATRDPDDRLLALDDALTRSATRRGPLPAIPSTHPWQHLSHASSKRNGRRKRSCDAR